MSREESRFARWCFEHRVELASLIGGVGFVFFLLTPVHVSRMIARALGGPEEAIVRGVYLFLALWNLAAGGLRIWAGGTLGGARMMAVHVQSDALVTTGPYAHVRNPIYLSDVMTLAGMGLVVPWPGTILIAVLLIVIYANIIRHEERALGEAQKQRYADFLRHVPRLGWRLSGYRTENAEGRFSFREGIVNNFIYLPLVPGFLVCALTGRLWHGVAVGAIGPLGWVVLHFWQNFKPGGLAGSR